jgi:hypothetical protein
LNGESANSSRALRPTRNGRSDEHTLHKAGSKTDVYETFRRMLQRGEVPTSIEQLLVESKNVAAV